MIKIGVVVTTKKLLQVAQTVSQKGFNNCFVFYLTTAENLSETIIQAIDEECDVLVARGGMKNFVNGMTKKIPIVFCSLTQGEFLKVLSEAKQQLGLPEHKQGQIAFLTNEKEIDSLVLSLELSQQLFEAKINIVNLDEVSPRAIIKAAKKEIQKGADMLVASTSIYEQIKRLPIPTHRLDGRYAHESMANAFRIAEQLGESIQAEQTYSRDLRIILEASFESIFLLNRSGEIIFMNDSAKRIIGKNGSTQQPIWQLLPSLKKNQFLDSLTENENVYGALTEINNTIYLYNIQPIPKDGRADRVVLFLDKFERVEKLNEKAQNELRQKGHVAKYTFADILGDSNQIQKIKETSRSFAHYDSTIMIFGETGTGKELFAQSIHNSSSRRNQPFVAVNCASLPDNLLESELFGYEKGAFTGALMSGKKGLFEQANKGTIFLDEISEMELSAQTRLLRVLEERNIIRIGGETVVPLDIRIIVATNRDMTTLIANGKFREDLYYRLNVLSVEIPPLWQRKEDICVIADSLIQRLGEKIGKNLSFTAESKKILKQFSWKGNVRQLRNFCERLAILANEPKIGPEFIENQLTMAFGYERQEKSLQSYEKQQILELMDKGIAKEEIAKRLGISPTTLWRRMKQYQIFKD
ncbi:sigma 54-interacting transcriptional regulator [Enterococcus massiliensis]|uniref:sigma 54-interacting transcriptional regulator n=1 Tax=Enterococcus massiliensis TaxID=1640685 RepID=UPI00065E70E2|nr:sigma 54-interacting transcriptional regulator [Enterococcus massiliensis]